jgi:SAM-dependent methyltransferase
MQRMKKSWYEEEDFWTALAPRVFVSTRWEDAPHEVRALAALTGVQPPAHVLDLCCGPGRHVIEFARQGYRVTGVDRTPAYLARAAQLAGQRALAIEFVQEDMRTFVRPGAFDAIFNLWTSFGYFDAPDDDRRVLHNIRTSLKAGGVFCLDVGGKEIVARGFRERYWQEMEDGSLLLEEHTIVDNWNRINDRWIFMRHGERREYHSGHRLYSAAELSALLHECGFKHLAMYGDFKGSPYDNTAHRLVIVARG